MRTKLALTVLALLVAGCGGSGAGGAGGGSAGLPGSGGVRGGAGVPGSGGGDRGGGSAGASGSGGIAGQGGATGGSHAGGQAGAAGAPGTAGRAGAAGSTGGAGGHPAPDAGAGADDATIVPDATWTCGAAAGIASPARGMLVFRATLQVSGTQDVGTTPYGHRRVLDVGGGTVSGSRLQATVLKGGYELELTLANGVVELEEIDVLRAGDGTLIYLRSCGVAPAGAAAVRIVPDFEVARSNTLAWLNTGTFAGTRTVDAAGGTIALDVYDVATVGTVEPIVQIAVPAGAARQPWDCSTATGAKGASVFTENVTLGASLSIGASKRGTPLDARYVISAGGEIIIVRNCGPLGALVPQFETRADGPYAFLNANTFVSSDPGSGSGGVGITFYQRQ